jgi:hypothetical protein
LEKLCKIEQIDIYRPDDSDISVTMLIVFPQRIKIKDFDSLYIQSYVTISDINYAEIQLTKTSSGSKTYCIMESLFREGFLKEKKENFRLNEKINSITIIEHLSKSHFRKENISTQDIKDMVNNQHVFVLYYKNPEKYKIKPFEKFEKNVHETFNLISWLEKYVIS